MKNKFTIFEQATGTTTGSTATTTGSTATTTGSTPTPRTRQQNVNSIYCSVRNGVITNKASQFRYTLWKNYSSKFVVKPEEIAAAEKVCPGTATLVPLTQQQISQKFMESAKTLGIENSAMDVQTLQAVLNILNPQQAVTESKIRISEEVNKMKYLLGYQRGKVISEQQSTSTDPKLEELIKQIQTVLKDKYKFAIVADGDWGNKTQIAFEDAVAIVKGRQSNTQQTLTPTSTVTPTEPPTSTVTPTETTTAPITPPAIPAEPVFDRNRLQELLASKNLVKKRNGVIVKWTGPELEGNDYYILDKYLIDKGYIQKKQRETGDRDDEDVTMKYKWKLQGEE